MDALRNSRGQFMRVICVNAHDRCYLGGPCPYCEPTRSPALARRAHAKKERG